VPSATNAKTSAGGRAMVMDLDADAMGDLVFGR